jgi:archaetidylinositol phosphate synthase
MRFPAASNEAQVIELFHCRKHTLPMETTAGMRNRISATIFVALTFFVMASTRPLRGAQLSPATAAAFDRYIQAKETASNRTLPEPEEFLTIDTLRGQAKSQAYTHLRNREILVERDQAAGSLSIPGGLIHDWIGLIFVPSISLTQAIASLQDYDRDSDYYRPQVLVSRLLNRSGDDFHVYLRLKQTHAITLVFDTEYDVVYTQLDLAHVSSRSVSTHIVEVQNPGQPNEHDNPATEDRGFLWRLNSYWRFYEAGGGVYIQCNAISLTRDVPIGLGWMIRPFIENIPRESLYFTLDATRRALEENFTGRPPGITRNSCVEFQRKKSNCERKTKMHMKQLATERSHLPQGKQVQIGSAAKSAPSFRDATRIQESITSSAERKVLLWLAVRIPSGINSDHLTLLGFVAMFLAGVSYSIARWHRVGLLLATFFLAVNWFGDSLDGTLARVRNCQRPRYGFYVDHIIDSFGALFLIGGLALSTYIDWRIAAAMLIAFLLLSIETYLATYTLGTFRLSFALFGPTEIRILLALGNAVLWFQPRVTIPGFHSRLLDFGGLLAACGMLLMAIVAAIWHTRDLYRQETKR